MRLAPFSLRSMRLIERLRDFCRADTGTVTVESVMILPVLLFGLQFTYGYYEAQRRDTLSVKANYAISDYLSRVPTIDQAMVDGLEDLLELMTQSEDGAWVRVSVVECTKSPARCNDYTPRRLTFDTTKQLSSESTLKEHTQWSMRAKMGPIIPLMYKGESLIVVETMVQTKPTFLGHWTGFHERGVYRVTVTGSREYDELCFEKGDTVCP